MIFSQSGKKNKEKDPKPSGLQKLLHSSKHLSAIFCRRNIAGTEEKMGTGASEISSTVRLLWVSYISLQ